MAGDRYLTAWSSIFKKKSSNSLVMRTLQELIILALICASCTVKEVSPRLNHVLLQVSNMERSVEFYTQAFGLEVTNNRIKNIEVRQDDGTTITRQVNIVLLKFPGQNFVYELSEHHETDSVLPAGLFHHVGIDVKDIDGAFDRAANAGAQVIVPVRVIKTSSIEAKQAFLKGPDGEIIELMQIISGEY